MTPVTHFLYRHSALMVGFFFCLLSLGIYATFIFPYFFNAPIPTIIFTLLHTLLGENHNAPTNLITYITLLILFVGLCYWFFKKAIRPSMMKRFTRTGMTILWMALLICILPPLFLYSITLPDWLHDDTAIPLLRSYRYYAWSSIFFPLLGLLIDYVSQKRPPDLPPIP